MNHGLRPTLSAMIAALGLAFPAAAQVALPPGTTPVMEVSGHEDGDIHVVRLDPAPMLLTSQIAAVNRDIVDVTGSVIDIGKIGSGKGVTP